MSPLGIVDARDDGLTRRRLVAAAAARGWAIGPALRESPGGPPAPTFPRTVAHAGGTTVVPAPARRPHAARTLAELDTLLALGVVPATVGSTGTRPGPSWHALAREADIAVMDATRGADVEQLFIESVDLVVVSSTLAAAAPGEMHDYRRLGVPVVQIPADDVGEQLRIVGECLGLDARAGRLAADVEARWARARITWQPATTTVFTCDEHGRVFLLTSPSLWSPPHELVELGPRHRERLQAELIVGLELEPGLLAGVEHSPWFAGLPAVLAGRYRRLDPVASYALCVPSVVGVAVAVDAVESVFTAAP